ncbi:hypothetical protein D9M72_496090 [compost metagenome]
MAAVVRIRLDAHAVGAAEGVEVVDVERAQVDLQGLEHVGDRHAELACLHPIEIGIELRHVDLVAGIEPRQFRRLVGLGEERLGRLVECLVAEAVLVLKLQLETACRAETLHGRRREHGDEGILDRAEFLVELHCDRAA